MSYTFRVLAVLLMFVLRLVRLYHWLRAPVWRPALITKGDRNEH